MKQYLKWIALLSVIFVFIGSAWLTHLILYHPFLPESTAIGEKNYAVVQNVSGHYIVSVIDFSGKNMFHWHTPLKNSINETQLCYSENTYYLWLYNKEENNAEVYNISNDNYTSLNAEENENLYGMNVFDETLSAIGITEKNNSVNFNVYLAGITAPQFTLINSCMIQKNIKIRDALYCKDGSVMFLTSEGSIYNISFKKNTPEIDLLYDCSKSVPQHLLTDCKGQIYLWNVDNKVYLLKQNNAFPDSEEMLSKIHYSGNINSLDECTSVYLKNNNQTALIHENDNGYFLVLYRNGILLTKNHINYLPWWAYAVVFLIILILISVIIILTIRFIFLFHTISTMQRRLAVICTAVLCITIPIITVYTAYVYNSQKTEQKWERLAITLNQTALYLKLTGKPESIENSSCVLFVKQKNGEYISVSGNGKNINKNFMEVYTPSTGSKIMKLIHSDKNEVSLTYNKYGTSWLMMIRKNSTDPSSLLIMQISSESNSEYEIYFVDAILFFMMAVFILLLILRIKAILKPLANMEIQAQKFTADENCDRVTQKGHNEISLLINHFNKSIMELKRNLDKSRSSAQAYERFLPQKWLLQLGTTQLSLLHAGDFTKKEMTILYLQIEISNPSKNFYEKIFSASEKNNGIPEKISPENMRILFPENSFGAVCTASMIKEAIGEQYKINAFIDYGKATLSICGDDNHSSIYSSISDEPARLAILRRVSSEFGCTILITGETAENIRDFHNIFNSRTIGFFTDDNLKSPVHLIEILTQKIGNAFEYAVSMYYAKKYRDAFWKFSEALKENPKDSVSVRYLHLCSQALESEEINEN